MKKISGILLSLLFLFTLGLMRVSAQEGLIEIPTVATLTGLNDHVNSVDFSSDDDFIITGDDAGYLSVWNANIGTLVTKWKATEAIGGVLKVQYSPDDQKIISTDGNAAIKIWDVTTGKLLSTCNAYTYIEGESPGAINDVVFNQDGTILYSSNYNSYSVIFWDVASGKRLKEITFLSNPLSLAYNPKDQQLAIGLADGSVNIRNAQTAAYIKAIPSWISNGAGVDKLSYSPNYDYLYGSNKELLRPYLLDVTKGYQNVTLDEGLYQLETGDHLWLDFSFSSNNKYIAVANPNHTNSQGTLTIFDTSTKKIVGSASAGSSPDTVAFSHDNKRVIAGKTIFDTSVLPNQELTGITIKTESEVMEFNQMQSISVYEVFKDGTEKEIDPTLITWNSPNPSVAKIMYGKLYSYQAGETTITASYENFQSSIVIQVQKYKEFNKQLNVAADKVWTVKFNLPVDPQTIKEKNIYITDEAGTKVPLLYYYVDQGTATNIQLSPVKNYISGENYTLWVKGVKSKTGKVLKQYTKMEFGIK